MFYYKICVSAINFGMQLHYLPVLLVSLRVEIHAQANTSTINVT
jgi:hypothetical protein